MIHLDCRKNLESGEYFLQNPYFGTKIENKM